MPLTLGVEEEFHLVDVASRHSTAAAADVLGSLDPDGDVVPELKASVAETNSAVCVTLDDLHRDLARLRRDLAAACGRHGVAPVAAGSTPLVGEDALAPYPKDRYVEMTERYTAAARRQVVCGVQTQVGIPDRDTAARVLSRAMRWAPVMTALAGSSPYWFGEDTGYASYRTPVWDRWPAAGPPAAFDSADEYDAVVAALLESRAILDIGMVYFDIRLSAHQPTVEFRVCDSTPRLPHVVMLAGLWRGIAAACLAELDDPRAAPLPRVELLRAARWDAARFGLSDRLVEPATLVPVPAAAAVDRLLQFVRPVTEATGDWPVLRDLVAEVLASRGSAQRQRETFARTGSLPAVVDALMAETADCFGTF